MPRKPKTTLPAAAEQPAEEAVASIKSFNLDWTRLDFQSEIGNTYEQRPALATGVYQGAVSSTGYQGAAMAVGFHGLVMGANGNALFLVHRANDGTITHAWAGVVGQNGIKANTWYSLGADGMPVECA